MGPIEESLQETFFPTLFGGEEVNASFRKILGYSVKSCGLGIPDSQLSEENVYNTSKEASWEIVGSLLEDTASTK